jgi:hypothetical protein
MGLFLLEILPSYPWSSMPWYLSAREHRPGWMRVDRLLGEHGIEADTEPGRLGFERRMERRRGEEEDPDWLQPLSHGWCIGSEEFREQMLEKIGCQVGQSHSGELRMESAASKARRIIGEELESMGWTEADLVHRRKSDPGKLALAARIKRATILPLKTIAAMVHLGTSKSASAKVRTWMTTNANDKNTTKT